MLEPDAFAPAGDDANAEVHGADRARPDGTRPDLEIAPSDDDVTEILDPVVERRRTAERDLIRHYCDEIGRYGVTLDADAAWDDYRRWILWGVIAWHLNINPNEDTIASLTRFGTAAEDLGTGAFYGY